MISRARQLPIIDIGGTNFYLDLRMNQFREVDDFSNSIDLDDLYELPNGKLMIAFNKADKNLFQGTEEEFKSNPDCVIVRLPSTKNMDPWGTMWLAYDKGWLTLEEAEGKAKRMMHKYEFKDGLMMQKKSNGLLEKKTVTKSKGKKL
jgi:hypothetical protein